MICAREQLVRSESPSHPEYTNHASHPPDKESHIFMRSKAEWDRTADELAKYETTSPDEIITGLQKAEILDRQ